MVISCRLQSNAYGTGQALHELHETVMFRRSVCDLERAPVSTIQATTGPCFSNAGNT